MTTTLNASTAGAGGFIATGDNSGSLALQTAGTTAVTITTAQNVGIGTATPTDDGGYGKIVDIYGSTGGAVYLHTSTATNYAFLGKYNSSTQLADSGSAGLTFATASGSTPVERMRIDTSGYLLVGTTSAVLSGKITSSFAGNAINGATFNDTTSASGAGFIIFSIGGTAIGNISRIGATSAVAYNTTSDQRLKSNIADSQSVLDKLMTVKVRQYDWTEGQVHQDYGFIAQELEPLLSGIVTKGKTDEDMWQLDYAKLTPHLVKAIQEQQATITAQAETINALTARVVALESK